MNIDRLLIVMQFQKKIIAFFLYVSNFGFKNKNSTNTLHFRKLVFIVNFSKKSLENLSILDLEKKNY